MHDILTIEKRKFDRFMARFKKGSYGTQRLGQAFYNHFKLNRLADQSALHCIHSKDGEHALNSIKTLFTFS